MTSISPALPQSLSLLRTTSAAAFHHRLPPHLRLPPVSTSATRCFQRLSGPRRSLAVASSATFVPPRSGVYIVGDFMTRKEDLHVVKPTTAVDEALDILVEKRITGFPVIDDNWKLVSVFSPPHLNAANPILDIVLLLVESEIET
ncbi:hypothetical protein CsSME_00005650 [Camellia sinensis var. sinensis]